jgi:pseudouridine-5'-phosphate glycosidase
VKHELSYHFFVADEVQAALNSRRPIVALESTVITHGLPYPQNRQLAEDMEAEIRHFGVIPATIAVVDGDVNIGIESNTLERLALAEDVYKISSRDIGAAIAQGRSGGTTVAATMYIAHKVGIQVFATGGIGGVHRQAQVNKFQQTWDISTDLPQLSKTPLIVICAGAKAVLDLPATLEYLETWGVPVVGYGVDEFPAFYARSSGLKIGLRAESAAEVVTIARAHWEIGMESAVLVANPPPEEAALPYDLIDKAVQQALKDAVDQNISGQQVTPFLLRQMSDLTHGSSLQANLSLLKNNARIAAGIAIELTHLN